VSFPEADNSDRAVRRGRSQGRRRGRRRGRRGGGRALLASPPLVSPVGFPCGARRLRGGRRHRRLPRPDAEVALHRRALYRRGLVGARLGACLAEGLDGAALREGFLAAAGVPRGGRRRHAAGLVRRAHAARRAATRARSGGVIVADSWGAAAAATRRSRRHAAY